MFVGSFVILAFGLGVVLLLISFSLKRNSIGKLVIMILALFLLLTPYILSENEEKSNRIKGESRAGFYQSIVNDSTDWININASGNFTIGSKCSDDTLSGKWKFSGGELEFFTLESDGFHLGQVTSHNNRLFITMPDELGCQTGRQEMKKIKY